MEPFGDDDDGATGEKTPTEADTDARSDVDGLDDVDTVGIAVGVTDGVGLGRRHLDSTQSGPEELLVRAENVIVHHTRLRGST